MQMGISVYPTIVVPRELCFEVHPIVLSQLRWLKVACDGESEPKLMDRRWEEVDLLNYT